MDIDTIPEIQHPDRTYADVDAMRAEFWRIFLLIQTTYKAPPPIDR